MRNFVMVCLFVCLLSSMSSAQGPVGWDAKPVVAVPAVVEVPVTATVTSEEPLTGEPVLKPMKIRKGLTIRQRRETGATFRNVRRVLAEMQASGEITEDMDVGTIALLVADHLLSDTPAAFQDPTFDWDAFLDFLERLIPLILKIIALFS